ncbi:MAG: peptidase domain-containing ABC transporter [Magnetococcales bacterium]|nr:peptidase domain-containing ABC transporter [Magnetococcales bacterium]
MKLAEDGSPIVRKLPAIVGGFKAESDFAACLVPLLEAMAWSGRDLHLIEALPHFADDLDLTGLRNVMANLNFTSRIRNTAFNKLDPRLLPCLFVPEQGACIVVLRLEGDQATVFDGGTSQYVQMPCGSWSGTAILFTELEDLEIQQNERTSNWFGLLSTRFRGVMFQIFGLALAMNILGLVSPFFMMLVYDKIAATRSEETLYYFVAGTVIVLFADTALRAIKTYLISFNSSRIGNIIGNEVFRRILFLPPSFTERAAVGSQVSRIKDFEVIRDFLASSAAMTLLELPFIVITMTVIFFLGGGASVVPLVMILLFFLTGIIIEPMVAEANAESAKASTRRQEFVIETLSHMRAVRYTGSVETWQERYQVLTSRSVIFGFRAAQLSSLSHTLSHVFMMASGVATMAVGVVLVLDKQLSTGGLVACMMLVWKVLGPLRSGFDSLPRYEQVRRNIVQLNKLMMLTDERSNKVVQATRTIRGAVTFDRVSMRYTPQSDPSLLGVSLDIQPGEVVAVVGRNGAGRSTLLKLLMGLYQPQAGKILIDGQDVRQMNPMELRRSLGYVPQLCQMFFGTIAQNIRLAHPTASDDDIHWAAEQVDFLEDILALPNGFRTRIGDSTVEQLPTSFRQRLNLARAFVKRPSIFLLDEPGNGLDFGNDQVLMNSIRRMKGMATVIISTHRPSHMRLADKLLWLEAGRIKRFGPASELLNDFMRDDS